MWTPWLQGVWGDANHTDYIWNSIYGAYLFKKKARGLHLFTSMYEYICSLLNKDRNAHKCFHLSQTSVMAIYMVTEDPAVLHRTTIFIEICPCLLVEQERLTSKGIFPNEFPINITKHQPFLFTSFRYCVQWVAFHDFQNQHLLYMWLLLFQVILWGEMETAFQTKNNNNKQKPWQHLPEICSVVLKIPIYLF